MAETKSLNQDHVTHSDGWGGELDHFDDLLHRIDQKLTVLTETLDKFTPLLERAAKLMDPGAVLRSPRFMKGGGRRDNPAG